MQVETYEIEEIKGSEASTMAADSEAIELITKLGLEGQQKLTNSETATRFPYPRLTSSQAAVFNALFPRQTRVQDFSIGIIPLRVLQVVAFCREFPQTQYIKVLHTATPKEDPILIGSPSQYSAEEYLLARWGDALPSFEELKSKAMPIIRSSFAVALAKAKTKLDQHLSSLDDIVRLYVETGDKPTWNIYD